MKKVKVLLLAAFAVFALTSVQAQEVRLGVKAGLNMASVGGDGVGYGSTYSGLGNRTAFHIGGFAEIPLSGNFSLQPEILYSSEGAGLSVGVISVGNDLKLDYVRVPVLAKYHMPFLEGLSAELGPVFGVLVSDSGSDFWGNNVEDPYSTFDAQIGIGATYRFDFGLHASLRYNKGLLNVYNVSDIPSGEAKPKAQSNVFQISAGYSF